MESRAQLLGHPIHPMLIPFPLGLLPTALVFDIIALSTDNARWADVSFWMITAGIIGALLAAVFGLIDLSAIPRTTRAFRIGVLHGAGNVVVVALFAVSWVVRLHTDLPPTMAVVLAAAGIGLALVTGWLGGELVDRLGVGVHDGANLNASSSLTRPGAPAGDRGTSSAQHLPPRPA
jgi:uncharacterized membrane protein